MLTAELLSILVPVHNEASTVATVIERLRTIDLPLPREIVIVNDGSTDGTREVLDDQARRDETLLVIHAEKNTGKGAAIRSGLASARGTIIAIQDADLELDPAQLASLVAPILSGAASVVYGSRFLAGRPAVPLLTLAANVTLTAVTNLLYRSRLTDMETCYKIMRTGIARGLQLESNRFDIEPEPTFDPPVLTMQHAFGTLAPTPGGTAYLKRLDPVRVQARAALSAYDAGQPVAAQALVRAAEALASFRKLF